MSSTESGDLSNSDSFITHSDDEFMEYEEGENNEGYDEDMLEYLESTFYEYGEQGELSEGYDEEQVNMILNQNLIDDDEEEGSDESIEILDVVEQNAPQTVRGSIAPTLSPILNTNEYNEGEDVQTFETTDSQPHEQIDQIEQIENILSKEHEERYKTFHNFDVGKSMQNENFEHKESHDEIHYDV